MDAILDKIPMAILLCCSGSAVAWVVLVAVGMRRKWGQNDWKK